MRILKKKFISVMLIFTLIWAIFMPIFTPLIVHAVAASGSCGTNVTYTFNPSTGQLVISGTGAMSDYRIVIRN